MKPAAGVLLEAAMKLVAISLTKQVLSFAASSARNGGTRRVFTSPRRGALAITANAHEPTRRASSIGTVASSRLSARDGRSPDSSRGLAERLQCHTGRQQVALRLMHPPSGLWSAIAVVATMNVRLVSRGVARTTLGHVRGSPMERHVGDVRVSPLCLR